MDGAQRNETLYRHQLIALVRSNEHLWNREDNLFCNRAFKLRTWEKIAEQFGRTAEKVSQTWESLRNQYRREYKNEMNFGIRIKWRFYQEMSFIRSAMRVKGPPHCSSDSEIDHEHTFSHNPPENTTVSPDEQELERFTAENSGLAKSSEFQPIKLSLEWKETDAIQKQQQLSSESLQPSQLCETQQEYGNDSTEEEELVIKPEICDIGKFEMETDVNNFNIRSEIRKRQQSQQPVEVVQEKRLRPREYTALSTYSERHDEDYHFVMSILPQLRHVPSNRKLLLRMEIMKLLLRELDEN